MKYIVKRITPDGWFGFNKKFYLVINGKEIFVRSFIYDFDLEEFGKKARKTKEEDGFFQVYGEKKHPLEEFEEELSLDRIVFKEIEENIWQFYGGYEKSAGGFFYIIWDKEIAKKIEENLKKVGKIKKQKNEKAKKKREN